ncbi:MAG: hypothetical protein Q7U41_01330, partial [Microbacterium sp.]|nr:hypothetical protein [Microbacterium sp.]
MTSAMRVTDSQVRVLLATADRTLESRLVDGLPAEGVLVVARALDGPTVLDRALGPAAPVAGREDGPNGIDVVVL